MERISIKVDGMRVGVYHDGEHVGGNLSNLLSLCSLPVGVSLGFSRIEDKSTEYIINNKPVYSTITYIEASIGGSVVTSKNIGVTDCVTNEGVFNPLSADEFRRGIADIMKAMSEIETMYRAVNGTAYELVFTEYMNG